MHSFFVPINAFASDTIDPSSNTELNDFEKATIVTIEEIDVPMYEEQNKSSNIVLLLKEGDEVLIVEEFEAFTKVKFVNEDLEEFLGYVENDYLNMDPKQKENNSELDKEELISNPENDELINPKPNSELDDQVNTPATMTIQGGIQPFSTPVNQKVLYGIALQSETKVFKSKDVNSQVLKKYPLGSKLKYKTTENPNWYEATVYINGKPNTGWIYKSHVQNTVDKQETLHGLALLSSTPVYERATTNSKVLKSYPAGAILKYRTLTNNWYEATVYIRGKAHRGFIHKNHVDNTVNDRGKTFYSYGINHPTPVYASPSTNSNRLKSYNYGHRLKYQALSENWYLATVYISGKKHTGYIYKGHLSNNLPVTEQGYAQVKETNVYQSASRSSKVLKSYFAGQLLKYRPYSSTWYVATVYVNGKANIGFIHKDDVGKNITRIAGYAQLEPTNVYESTSKSSKVLKSYRAGHVLQYQPHNDSWYKATVYVNGVAKTGYIHKNDVGNSIPTLEGYALLQPTYVYAATSTTSTRLKNYNQATVLKYQPYNSSWYSARVKVNGKWRNGYIHRNHVSSQMKKLYDIEFSNALNLQMKVAHMTDQKYAWVSKKYIDSTDTVTASTLNVRTSPNENNKDNIIGTLTKGTKVKILDEYNGWFAIEYNHPVQWRQAAPKDIRYYFNPNNFVNDPTQRFQFLDLSKVSGATATQLNNYLNDKGSLRGQGQSFIDAGKQHGINEVYLISHAFLETGHGTSVLSSGSVEVGLISSNKYFIQNNNTNKYYIAEYKYIPENDKNDWVITETNILTRSSAKNIKKIYNMFGIGAFDRDPLVFGSIRAYDLGWDTPRKAILGGAAFIGNDYIKAGQNTLYKMRWNPDSLISDNKKAEHQYATDIRWAAKQVHKIYEMYNEIGISNYYFEIPVYK